MLSFIGKILQYTIISIYLIHSHIFFCISCMIGSCIKDSMLAETVPTLINATGPVITTSIVVFSLNYIANIYNEIQSWQIAYILWSIICAILHYIQEIMVYMSKGNNRKKIVQTFDKLLLYPFGIKPSETGDSGTWSLPLVSTAPAIVGGYIANYILIKHYELECDPSYHIVSDICERNVCCIVVKQDTNWIYLVTLLASYILTAWGIVKSIGYFIAKYDNDIMEQKNTIHTEPLLQYDNL
eukprot:74443_1